LNQRKKLKGTKETINYIVMYSYIGVNRSTWSQAGIWFWINKSTKNAIINYTYWSESIVKVKPNIGRANLSLLDSTSQKKEEAKKTKTFITNYGKYYN
jgi:hypothetical protein